MTKKKKKISLTLDQVILIAIRNSNELSIRIGLILDIRDEFGSDIITDRLESKMLRVSLDRLRDDINKLLNKPKR